MLLSKTLKNSPSGLFFSVYLLNAREINRATKIENPLKNISDSNPPKIEEPLKTGLRQRASLGSSI